MQRPRLSIPVALFGSLFALAPLAGCGDPPSLYGDTSSSSSAGGGQQPPDNKPSKPTRLDYPAGPYSSNMGEVIPNFKFGGYRLSPGHNDSSQLKWDETIEMNDFHNDPKVKCMLFSYGASWCGACQQEQGALPSDVAADPTFGVINILIEGPGNGSNKVSKSDVDDWTQHFMQNYPVVYGGNSTEDSRADLKAMWNPYGPSIGLPFNIIVKVPSMTVVDVIQGFSQTIHKDAMDKCAAAP